MQAFFKPVKFFQGIVIGLLFLITYFLATQLSRPVKAQSFNLNSQIESHDITGQADFSYPQVNLSFHTAPLAGKEIVFRVFVHAAPGFNAQGDIVNLIPDQPPHTTLSLNQEVNWNWGGTIPADHGCFFQIDAQYAIRPEGGRTDEETRTEVAAKGTIPGCGSTPTPTPTCSTTPTPTPTLTTTPTPTGSLTPTPTSETSPTPTPTREIHSCLYECGSDSDCDGGLRCLEKDGVKRCLNNDCTGENDCACNRSCWEVCGTSDECPSGLECKQIDDLKRCVKSSCDRERDCNCGAEPTPTPTGQVLGASTLPQTGYNALPLVLGLILTLGLRSLILLI